jgi:hypothetical protein
VIFCMEMDHTIPTNSVWNIPFILTVTNMTDNGVTL